MAARNGLKILRDGEVVETVPAALLRAKALRGFRRHEADVVAGRAVDADASAEAEAGAILDAETAGEIHDLREMVHAWLEAQR